jgi:peptidylprolyl isomerase
LPWKDSYAAITGFWKGWPVGSNGQDAWLTHCYAMVGAGREVPPDAGNGAELYAVIGQSPRQLDRNIALVGRVVHGIENLSSLPRGKAEIGMYADDQPPTPIVSVRMAAELPETERPHIQMLDIGSPAFGSYMNARSDRRDVFYLIGAKAADICNIPVPFRLKP